MKSTISQVFALSLSLLAAGACAPDAASPNPESNLSLLSNGPDLPEECNECWDEFQNCFSEGNATDECAIQIVGCVESCQAPPPPQECLHCAAGFDACAQAAESEGDTAEDCAIGFEGCLSACEGEAACEDSADLCEPGPEPGDCQVCDVGFDDCINDSWQDGNDESADGEPNQGDEDPGSDAERCEQEWNDCWQACEPGTPDDEEPGDEEPGQNEEELCQIALEECENDEDGFIPTPDGDEISCHEVFEFCEGSNPEEPLPEEEPDQACEFWLGQLDDCQNNPDPPNDCQELEDYCGAICP